MLPFLSLPHPLSHWNLSLDPRDETCKLSSGLWTEISVEETTVQLCVKLELVLLQKGPQRYLYWEPGLVFPQGLGTT